MRSEALKEARAERQLIRGQGMCGYVIFHPAEPWDGHLYQRLHRAVDALKHAPAGSEVVMAHYPTGALYYQLDGRVLGVVLTEGGRRHHVQVVRHERRAIVKRRRALHQPTPTRTKRLEWNGKRHPGYID